MMLLRNILFIVLTVVLLGALGLLLGADCMVVALIGLLTLAGLLQSIMGAEEMAPHTVR